MLGATSDFEGLKTFVVLEGSKGRSSKYPDGLVIIFGERKAKVGKVRYRSASGDHSEKGGRMSQRKVDARMVKFDGKIQGYIAQSDNELGVHNQKRFGGNVYRNEELFEGLHNVCRAKTT